MDEMDKTDDLHAISDEDLMMREVIQDDAELCYLHHYLSEIFRKG